jgi:ribosome-interacting GTPase 1
MHTKIATNYHLGTLKAKLAKLRDELFVEQSGGSGGGGAEGFSVARNGDARVALIGFPSVGKSSLLSTLTSTESVAAGYEFTTLTCIPGVLHYLGSKVQILDLPGIVRDTCETRLFSHLVVILVCLLPIKIPHFFCNQLL